MHMYNMKITYHIHIIIKNSMPYVHIIHGMSYNYIVNEMMCNQSIKTTCHIYIISCKMTCHTYIDY